MEENLEQLEGKNWMATMALCWLFGTFGAHRFYTGKTTTAWVMLIMSFLGLTPISAIWAFVDGVTIALGNFCHEDGSELYERVEWFGYLYITLCILGIISFGLLWILFSAAFATMYSGGLIH